MTGLVRRSAWAHRAGLAGTGLVVALAALLVSVAGVLAETGLRQGGSDPGAGLLLVLASSFAGTVLLVVVLVVVATVSLALRGRLRELALLRTVGATRAQLRRQIGAEVLLVGALAAPSGAAAGMLAARSLTTLMHDAALLHAGDSLALSPLPVLGATAVVLPIAWIAAQVAARGALQRSATEALRDSAVEAGTVGVVRRVAALVVAGLGLASAMSPLVVPGTVGSAAAATSAFLLVGAAALAGPLLITGVLARTRGAQRRLGVAGRLAVTNVRGFSRRLTVVVVPLALALTAGTAQTTVDRTVARAAETQLREGVRADLVVAAPTDASGATDLPGVIATSTLSAAPARVRTDADLDGVVDALAWEPTTVRSLTATADPLVDLDVTAGSLAGLSAPDTVAISGDATFDTGFGIGSRVPLRWADGSTSTPTVVAVYERGLGFGDYLVDPGTLAGHEPHPEVLLVDAAEGADAEVATGLAGLGLHAESPASYAESATTAGTAERRLSTVLLLGLLAFVFLAAANTLVLVTSRRRGELLLYSRTGATRRQLLRMTTVEALITGGLAWLVGTAAVVPSVLGVGFGLLGPVVPPVDLGTYLALSAAVLLLPLLGVVPSAARVLRPGPSARPVLTH